MYFRKFDYPATAIIYLELNKVMRILNLPVDDSIADGYNNASQKEKKKINSVINMLLAKFLNDKGSLGLLSAMDELSVQSSKNDLTLDKLKELMDWDDDTVRNLFGEGYHSANA